MAMRAARSIGLPYEWRMPLESRPAPAHESILFCRDDVEGVHARAQVEVLLAAVLDEVLVRGDARGLERVRRELLLLVGHHVAHEGQQVDATLLVADVEDADLRRARRAAVAT